MNTESTTELEPYTDPITVRTSGTTGSFARLWRLYQQLGLNPEQSLAAARADVACGLVESPSGSDTR